MLSSIISFNPQDKEKLAIAFEIRRKVFIEEQNVDKNIEVDGLDDICTHYLLFLNNIGIATVRYRQTKEGIKIERFAVLKEYRGKEFGKMLLIKMLEDLKKSRAATIYLNAQESAVNFYLRNGFIIQGQAFVEANIVHYKMVYENY